MFSVVEKDPRSLVHFSKNDKAASAIAMILTAKHST
jgi:hypothetical protein